MHNALKSIFFADKRRKRDIDGVVLLVMIGLDLISR